MYSRQAGGGGRPAWPICAPSCIRLLVLVTAVVVFVGYVASIRGADLESAEQAEREKKEANVVRVSRVAGGITGSDKRGWILSPLHAAAEHGLGGATSCLDVHVGIIGPGMSRANHRHHVKNESFLVWGAKASWRIENKELPLGFVDVHLEASDVTVMTAPVGRAHALGNVDKTRTLNLMVCADMNWDPNHPDTDYGVWKDLKTK